MREQTFLSEANIVRKITRKQSIVLLEITSFVTSHDYPPSVRDLAGNLGKAPSTIHRQLIALKDNGFIEWDPARIRTLRLIRNEKGEANAN
jgi:SOS-response transcriptional repressor LexA